MYSSLSSPRIVGMIFFPYGITGILGISLNLLLVFFGINALNMGFRFLLATAFSRACFN